MKLNVLLLIALALIRPVSAEEIYFASQSHMVSYQPKLLLETATKFYSAHGFDWRIGPHRRIVFFSEGEKITHVAIEAPIETDKKRPISGNVFWFWFDGSSKFLPDAPARALGDMIIPGSPALVQ